jgi:putative transcriptional regulator
MKQYFNNLKTLETLTGLLLVATPQLQDPRFNQAVIYVCGHDKNGAMGLVINKMIESLMLKDLLAQLNVDTKDCTLDLPIHLGGPLDMGRGFVLHSTDYMDDSTVKVSDKIALTATIDLLMLIARNKGPQKKFIALGYAGWTAKQLEAELHDNSWFIVEPEDSLLFSEAPGLVWKQAINKIGIDPDLYSSESGHA